MSSPSPIKSEVGRPAQARRSATQETQVRRGTSRRCLDSTSEQNLYHVAFLSDQEGWIFGDYGTILHTTDVGGQAVAFSRSAEQQLPARGLLFPNYPNPFNPTTTIAYEISQPSDVRIAVFDLLAEKCVCSWERGKPRGGTRSPSPHRDSRAGCISFN